MSAVLWLRRDLRRADLPALGAAAAAAGGGGVAVLFVVDPQFFGPAGVARRAWLARTLLALRETYEGRLVLRSGDPVDVVPALAAEVGATSVHVSTETEPAGAARDERVRRALAAGGVEWVATGSPYAVTPGRLRTGGGGGFQVFTPFSRAWRDHGWPGPAAASELRLLGAPGDDEAWSLLAEAAEAPGVPALPEAGEAAALRRWAEFREGALADYAEDRNRVDLDGTSTLSPYLKLGVVHPRTLLADLAGRPGDGPRVFVSELAWREFYADVLFRHPESLDADLRPLGLAYDEDPERLDAWQEGRTGYPIVDAGMRQLLATGWMHNRVRMITASFLTKDLHQWWPAGARWFDQHLIDADLASNAHGWQWTAGTGTDAAPYFRVFNPILQGRKFDPRGDYVRRWVPELRHLEGPAVHEPWLSSAGGRHGYPERIVDHAEQRAIALARYQQAKGERG